MKDPRCRGDAAGTMLRYGCKRPRTRLLPWMSAAKRRGQRRAEYASCADTAGQSSAAPKGCCGFFRGLTKPTLGPQLARAPLSRSPFGTCVDDLPLQPTLRAEI